MLKFLLGAAVGYVLGAKAGHERYEQLGAPTSGWPTTPPCRARPAWCGRGSRSVNGGKHTADAASNGHAR